MIRIQSTGVEPRGNSAAIADSLRILIERDSLQALADQARVDSVMGQGIAAQMAPSEHAGVFFYTAIGLALGAVVLGLVIRREGRRDRNE